MIVIQSINSAKYTSVITETEQVKQFHALLLLFLEFS